MKKRTRDLIARDVARRLLLEGRGYDGMTVKGDVTLRSEAVPGLPVLIAH